MSSQPELFEFQNYKTYVEAFIDKSPNKGRGVRSAIAEAVHCQTAYISQVLNGTAQLSLEQAEDLARYFLFDSQQLDYFLNLVQLERAATPSLRHHFKNRLEEIRSDRLNLKKRFDIQPSLSTEQQATYYSSWVFPAIHVAVSIKRLQTPNALAEEFSLPLRTVRLALQFLEGVKLIELKANRYVIGPMRIHLGQDSPMIGQSHTIWRTRANELFNQRNISGLHYSSVVTLSAADAEKIHKMLVECIEKAKSVVRDSPEEEVRAFCVDFFKPS